MPAVAALDRAGEHGIRRPVAEEGAQQARARTAHRGWLERRGKRLTQELDQLDMGVGKTVLAVAHQAQALDRAVAILERHSQIVGAARRGHLVQHPMVALPQVQEPATEALAPLDDVLEGAAIIRTGREGGPGHHVLMRVRSIPGPDDPPGAGQRIGELLPGAQAPERHPELDQLAAEAIDQLERRQREPRLGDQPASELSDAVVVRMVVHAVHSLRTRAPPGVAEISRKSSHRACQLTAWWHANSKRSVGKSKESGDD